MATPQAVLDRFADGVPYASLAEAFLDLDGPAGDEPLVLLATAVAGTASGVETVSVLDSVRETCLEEGAIRTFADLAALESDDEALRSVFSADRKRRLFREVACVLADRPERSDLESLRSWAAEADVYRYDRDPIGEISGIGPSSFQSLRQLAGIDTARPNASLASLLESVADESRTDVIDTNDPLVTLASCEWLSLTTTYRALEIDRLAWWLDADEDERAAAVEGT